MVSGNPPSEENKSKGFETRSQEDLIKLITTLSGWGDQSGSINIGYKRRKDYDGFQDSYLNDKAWGYVVETTLCGPRDYNGKSVSVASQGVTLPEALWNLADAVHKEWHKIAIKSAEWRANADKALREFKEVPKPIDGPYR